MNRLIKLAVPALALGMFAFLPQATVSAEDAPTATQPAKAAGAITVRVVDGQGNPVEGATVQITVKPPKGKKKKDPTAVKEKPQSLAQGKTDAQGLVTLDGIPEGSYRAVARLMGTGIGHEDVMIAAPAPAAGPANPPVTITLKPKKGAPTPPATQPA